MSTATPSCRRSGGVAKQMLTDWQRGKLPFFVLPPGCEPPAPSHRATKATAIATATDQCNIAESRSDGTEAPAGSCRLLESPAGSEDLVHQLSEPGELEGQEQGLDEDEEETKESTSMPPPDASGDDHEADEDDEFQALGRLLANASSDTDTEWGSDADADADADVDHTLPAIKDRSCTVTEIPTRKPRRVRPAPAKRASFGRIKPAVATKKSSKYKNTRGVYHNGEI